jgi:hypothetical protein
MLELCKRFLKFRNRLLVKNIFILPTKKLYLSPVTQIFPPYSCYYLP